MVLNTILKHSFLTKDTFKGWLIMGPGKEIHKLKLKHLVLPENKEMLKIHNDWRLLNAHGGQLKVLPTATAVTIWEEKKIEFYPKNPCCYKKKLLKK